MKENKNRELLKKLIAGEISMKDLLPKSLVMIMKEGKIIEATTGKEIPEAVIDRAEIVVILPANEREVWNKK